MKQFYIKDLSKLEQYGFFTANETEYWIRLKKSLNIIINKYSKMMTFFSPSKDAIALVCEMYKDGVIEIFDDQEPATFNMKVTEEEMKVIFDLRNEKKST